MRRTGRRSSHSAATTSSPPASRRAERQADPMRISNLPACALLFVVPVAVFAQAGDNTADHAEMMAKLHITSPVRPGPAGRLNPDGSAPPNFANYNESKATAKSPVPLLLAMSDGRKITT